MNSQRISTILSIVIFALIVWGANLVKEVNLLEEKVLKFEDAPEIKDNDLKWLALNIYHEARGESIDGMIAVGVVTMNRVNSNLYPNSIEQVVKQSHQSRGIGMERMTKCTTRSHGKWLKALLKLSSQRRIRKWRKNLMEHSSTMPIISIHTGRGKRKLWL